MAGRPRKVQRFVVDPSIAGAVASALHDQAHTHEYDTRTTRSQVSSSPVLQAETFSPSWGDYEDFGPPAEELVEQRSWTRKPNGTTEVVNSVQSIVHIEARLCDICQQSKDPDNFLLCDNYACNRGGHYTCYGLGHIPDGKWFCSQCRIKGKCMVCRKLASNQPLTSCEHCELFGHITCVAPGQNLIVALKDAWRCKNCACQRCFSFDAITGRLIQCAECGNFRHKQCFELGEILEPEGKWASCPSCTNEIETCETTDDEDIDGNDGKVETQEEVASGDPLLSRPVSPDLPLLSFQGADSLFQLLCTRDKAQRSLKKLRTIKPFSYFALEEYMRTGIPGGWVNVRKLAMALCPKLSSEDLDVHRPPLNANRTLDSLIPLKLKTTIVEVSVISTRGTSIKARGPFHHRDLAEAVAELLACPANASVPLQPISEKGCKATCTPPRLYRAFEDFCKTRRVALGDLVVPRSFYSDGTATSFSHLHPITVSLFTAAKGPRVLKLTTSHAIVGMVPTPGTIEYFDASGNVLSSSQANHLIAGPAPKRAILRSCVQVLMKELKVLENGVPFYDGNSGQPCRLFGFFYNWVADMEERRDLLDLVLGNHWVCSHCFGRPVNNISSRVPEAEKLISANAPRSDANIKAMMQLLKDEDVLVGKERYRFEDRTGFERSSKPALSSGQNFIYEGAAVSCFVDRLHLLDGVLNRIWTLLEVLYGKSLTQATVRLGNMHYGVTSEFRFHKMEEALADFRFLVFAFVTDFQRIEHGEQASLKLKPKVAKTKKKDSAIVDSAMSNLDDGPSEEEIDESSSEEEEATMDDEGTTENEASEATHERTAMDMFTSASQFLSHLRMVAAFQLIIACLKDDAPVLVQHMLENAIEVFGQEIARLETDTRKASNKNFEETAKLHELLCHVAEQVRENGSLSLFSSEELEWLHPKNKKWMSCGSKRRADQAKTVLKQSYYEAVHEDEGRSIIDFSSGARFAPILPAVSFQDNSRAKQARTNSLRKIALLGLYALDHHNYKFSTSAAEMIVRLDECISAHREILDTPYWVGTSLTMELLCRTRGTALKSPTTFKVLAESTEKRQHLVVAYGTATAADDERKQKPCCRFHDPSFEFECSLARILESDTRYSFPLGFVQPYRGKTDFYMLGLAVTQLKEQTTDAVVDRIVVNCQIERDPNNMFVLVPAKRLRTNCFVLGVEDRLFVMKCSNRIAGHLT